MARMTAASETDPVSMRDEALAAFRAANPDVRISLVPDADVDFTEDLDVVDLRRRQVREMGPKA